MANNDYRTPSIEEFVEGFEYEFFTDPQIFSFGIMDMEGDVDGVEFKKQLDANRKTFPGEWVKKKFVKNKFWPTVQLHEIIDYIMKGRIRCQNIPRIH
jgi:hypothetical protein